MAPRANASARPPAPAGAAEPDLSAMLLALARTPRGARTEQDVCDRLIGMLLDLTGFDSGAAFAAGHEERATVLANRGVDEGYVRYVVEHYTRFPGLDAMRRGETLVVNDVLENPGFEEVREPLSMAGIRSLVVLPMQDVGHEIRGAVSLYCGSVVSIGERVVRLCQSMADFAALVIANERLRRAREYFLQQSLLEKSQEVVATLTAGIAHDFNNLLGGMLGFVTLAPTLEREELSGLCVRLEAQVEQASQLSRNLLQLARTSAAPQEEGAALLNVAVQAAMDTVRPTLGAGITMTLEAGGEALWGEISLAGFSRVVLNLLLNAAQALDGVPAGRVSVRLRGEGEFCIIEVDDNGPGVPKEHEERIFQPFTSIGKGQAGAGVGLATARAIVERAGGSLTLAYREGPGACFRVTLRRAAPEAAGALPARHVSGRGLHGEGRRVLVAEDDPVQRRAFVLALREAGYDVEEVTDGEAASEALAARSYDLAILDHGMPKRPGGEIAARLRREGARLPLVLVTGFGVEPELGEAADSPFTLVIQKPVKGEVLVDVVAQLLEGNAG